MADADAVVPRVEAQVDPVRHAGMGHLTAIIDTTYTNKTLIDTTYTENSIIDTTYTKETFIDTTYTDNTIIDTTYTNNTIVWYNLYQQ